jgi:hypothetical protein
MYAYAPLLLYMKASLTITVRPLAVVNCLAFPRASLKLPVSLTCPLGPTPPGTRSTWLARKSSDPLRSMYEVPDSLSRDVRRTSVVGTRSTYIVSLSNCASMYEIIAYVVLDWLALAGECTTEEGP